MIVIEDKFKTILPYKTHVTLGSFDGLHLGHLELINKTVKDGRKKGYKSMVYTFKNHPLTVLNEEISPNLLMDNETKIQCFSKLGLDILNLMPFDKECMNMEPEQFIKYLVNCYGVKEITVGFNFKFGKRNKGDINFLKNLQNKFSFDLNIINPIKIDDEIISSTFIRGLIRDGEIERANKLLYTNFSLSGNVVKGKSFGRKLGFPTANLDFDLHMMIPKTGVYYTNVYFKDEFFKAITNIGYSPTVDGKNFTVETHIINFNKDIYGENIRVYFIKRIRDEHKFNCIEELMKQLNKDKQFAIDQ